MGAKFFLVRKKRILFGLDSAYSYLVNTYSPDPSNTRDDAFEESSNATQTQTSAFLGITFGRWTARFNYIFQSEISNDSSFSPLQGENSYAGTGYGFSLSFLTKSKRNLYFEYQQSTLDEMTVNGATYKLPTTASGVSLDNFTTTNISAGISFIF